MVYLIINDSNVFKVSKIAHNAIFSIEYILYIIYSYILYIEMFVLQPLIVQGRNIHLQYLIQHCYTIIHFFYILIFSWILVVLTIMCNM